MTSTVFVEHSSSRSSDSDSSFVTQEVHLEGGGRREESDRGEGEKAMEEGRLLLERTRAVSRMYGEVLDCRGIWRG